MTQQGDRQASVRAVTGTALDYNGDWLALFDVSGIAAGAFNGRLLAWINTKLGATYADLDGALWALANANGATNFQALGAFDASTLWQPEELGTLRGASWDARRTDLITLFPTATSAVNFWADSVSGYSAGQGTTSLKPIWSATSFNGGAGVTFDGVDDVLAISPSAVPANVPVTGDSWVFALVQNNAGVSDAARYVVSWGASGDGLSRTFGSVGDGTAQRVTIRNGGATPGIATAGDTTGYCVIAFQLTGASVNTGGNTMRVNGVSVPTSVVDIGAIVTATTRMRIGAAAATSASGFWKGQLALLGILNGTPTTLQVQQYEAWMLWEYGLQSLLPSDSPFRDVRPYIGATGVTDGGLVANRTQVPTALITLGAALPYTFTRDHYASPQGDTSRWQTIDCNWYYDSSHREAANPSDVTFKRYLEWPSGVFWPVTWGGSSTVTMVSGGMVKSDPMPAGFNPPAGALVRERSVVLSFSGAATLCAIELPAVPSALGVGDGYVQSQDLGNSGTIPAHTTSVNTFGAAAIIGRVACSSARSFLMVGDSILWGVGDTDGVGVHGGSGYLARMLDPAMPWAKIAKPGQTANDVLSSYNRITALLNAIGYTDLGFNYFANDLGGGSSAATVEANWATLANLANKGGLVKTSQCTSTCLCDSTDGFTTVAGQTIRAVGSWASAPTCNDYVRAVPAYLTGQILDVADACMTGRNSMIWATPPVPVISDGTHPNTGGAAQIAAYLQARFV